MKSIRIDSIITHRLNPKQSGVAKFNQILADHLKVPLFGIYDDNLFSRKHPLFSFKVSEIGASEIERLSKRVRKIQKNCVQSSLLFHTFSDHKMEHDMLKKANAVYCGNSEILDKISGMRAQARELWLPATLQDKRLIPKTDLSVFSFGMAHKIKKDSFSKLKNLLDKTKKSYSLLMSTAFHESVSFDESSSAFTELDKIFKNKFYHLGFLSDTAVFNLIHHTTFLAAFFEKGVRSNNSTVLSAMQSGCAVITNLDKYSPKEYKHMENIIDINQCLSLPTDLDTVGKIKDNAKTATKNIDFKNFIGNFV